MAETKLRILLADDQILLLQSLKMAIEALASDMEIVATARNGEEALAVLESQPVDVALLDVRMPGMDGITAAEVVRRRWPEVSVIMLTTFEDEQYVARALAIGVHGYLLKNIAPEKLISGIREVKAGTVLLGTDVAGLVAQALSPSGSGRRPLRLPTWFYELTPREKTLVRLVLHGKTNKEIAAEVNLGEQTIRNYMSLLYEKLGVSDRRDALSTLQSVDPSWFV